MLESQETRFPDVAQEIRLPTGVEVRSLLENADDRGTFTEIFRDQWNASMHPVQWNMVRSRPRVLRGVHAHLRHSDYLVVVEGRATIGFVDLRPGSATYGASTLLTLSATRMQAVAIPPGIAHGFYFHEPSIHVYAVSDYWDSRDELGCRWDDPALGLAWPDLNPRISERDDALPGLDELRSQIRNGLSVR